MKVVAEGLLAGYEKRLVLAAISLRLRDGEMVGIIGPNGSGKTTLLKVLGRLMRPRGGTVYLDGRALRDLSPGEVARCLALVPQAPFSPPELTVYELVGYGRHPHLPWLRRFGTADREVIEGAIADCRLQDLAQRPLSTLSGGERQRAWLAMALAQQPQVILLDEPVTFLDINHQLEVMELATALNAGKSITVAVVMHDINLASRYCQRLIALKDGNIVADGSPESVVQPEVIREVFGVDARVIPDPVTGKPMCYPYRARRVPESAREGGKAMAKLGICLAAHGVPAKDYPRDRWREFVRLSADRLAGAPVPQERSQELEQDIRSWPRNPENDPYRAGAEAVAQEMRRLGYDLVEVGYSEFCNPAVEEAIDRLVDAGAERVTVVSTMLVPGGAHAEVEIARSVAAAQERHPQVPITYAWPYDTARSAGFYGEQAERLFAGQAAGGSTTARAFEA